MKEITFVTGNIKKFEIAQKAMQSSGFFLVRRDLDTPEIQSENVEEIARFSAKWASDHLRKPVVLTDAGYYIEALNGFPGPFIKYINKWLTADDVLNLMKGKENRDVKVRDCLAYCEPGSDPIAFSRTFKGKISLSRGKKGATPINKVFIPDGFDKPESEIPWQEMRDFWGRDSAWQKLIAYLESKK